MWKTFSEIDANIHITWILSDQDFGDAVQPIPESDSNDDGNGDG